ncbi:MAG TPA: hypothetical protein VIL49_18370, partial [Capillimicrobium sp.]
MSAAAGVLRPLPFRGDLIAAGGVVLAVGVLVLVERVSFDWTTFPGQDVERWAVLVLIAGLTAALLIALAWRAPVEGAAPRAYVSALLLAAAPLVMLALDQLSYLLGNDDFAEGAEVWKALAFVALYALLAWGRASAACALLAAAVGIEALTAAVAWRTGPVDATTAAAVTFDSDPLDPTGLRWVLALAVVGFAGSVAVVRPLRPRHAHALAIAAGLAALALYAALGGPYGGVLPFAATGEAVVLTRGGTVETLQPPPPAAWWDLVLLAVGAGLLLFARVERERERGARGVAWAGALVLLAFTTLVADGDASLLWWPLLLGVGGAGAMAAGLALRRGDVSAAGGIGLALAVGVTVARFEGAWAAGVLALIAAAGAALLLVTGLRAPRDDPDRLDADTLPIASFPLALAALAMLAVALGGGLTSAGTITWVGLSLAVGYGALATVRGSGALTLLAAVAGVGGVVAGVLWVFEPSSPAPLRWVLLAAILALGVVAVRLRDHRHPQAVGLAVVAGIAAAALVQLLQWSAFVESQGSDAGTFGGFGLGWELLILGAGFALCAFGAVDRAHRPAR